MANLLRIVVTVYYQYPGWYGGGYPVQLQVKFEAPSSLVRGTVSTSCHIDVKHGYLVCVVIFNV